MEMELEVLTEHDDLVIRRLKLAAGEKMYWHRDACDRFTVVVRGTRLRIEYRDSGEILDVDVEPGLAGWDGPDEQVHRAINLGPDLYEEIVTFYRKSPHLDPQPRIE